MKSIFQFIFFQVQNKEDENRALQNEMAEARRKHEVSFAIAKEIKRYHGKCILLSYKSFITFDIQF